MKQFLAICFIGAVSALFGFAKGVGTSIHIPEVITLPNAADSSVKAFNDLSVRWVKNAAELNWTAFTKQDNKQYEVQRSVNGGAFQTVAVIFTIESADQVKKYTFKDAVKSEAKGAIQYRIKQVSIGEEFSFSNTVSLQKK